MHTFSEQEKDVRFAEDLACYTKNPVVIEGKKVTCSHKAQLYTCRPCFDKQTESMERLAYINSQHE